MKKIKRLVAVLVLLAVSCICMAVEVGQRAPEWELEDADGEAVVFPDAAEGQVSILFFWASWCPYCHAMMPYLQAIKQDYAEQQVEVYAVDFKDDGDPVKYMEKAGFDFVVLPVGDLVAEDYNVWSAPGLFVIDQQGRVVYRRGQTKAPPGKKIAELWDGEIRRALDSVIKASP